MFDFFYDVTQGHLNRNVQQTFEIKINVRWGATSLKGMDPLPFLRPLAVVLEAEDLNVPSQMPPSGFSVLRRNVKASQTLCLQPPWHWGVGQGLRVTGA